jgi:hypothetical protein
VTQSDAIVLDPEADQECAQFQASMAERISNGEDLQDHPHMATCERCTALVRELETIAEVARMLMPIDAEPGEDLWKKIEGKLAMESAGNLESLSERESEEEKQAAREGGIDELGGLAFEGGMA